MAGSPQTLSHSPTITSHCSSSFAPYFSQCYSSLFLLFLFPMTVLLPCWEQSSLMFASRSHLSKSPHNITYRSGCSWSGVAQKSTNHIRMPLDMGQKFQPPIRLLFVRPILNPSRILRLVPRKTRRPARKSSRCNLFPRGLVSRTLTRKRAKNARRRTGHDKTKIIGTSIGTRSPFLAITRPSADIRHKVQL